jgi:hypothetical protein
MPNTIHCEVFGSATHATNQFRAFDALIDRLDRMTFRVNETPQGLRRGLGSRGGCGFRGERNGGRGPGQCYNCDEQGHMARITRDDLGSHTTELTFTQMRSVLI